jgi:hypothetical protein
MNCAVWLKDKSSGLRTTTWAASDVTALRTGRFRFIKELGDAERMGHANSLWGSPLRATEESVRLNCAWPAARFLQHTKLLAHELDRLTRRPKRKLAVLTCMDTRLSIGTLSLKIGEAHIIHHAAGIVRRIQGCEAYRS